MKKQAANHIRELITPVLVLDVDRCIHNISSKQHKAQALGVALRPHLKTSKCLGVASLFGSLDCAAVSTLTELVCFFDAGIHNLRYTAPFSPDKVSLVAPLIRKGLHFEILADDPDMLTLLNQRAIQEDVAIHVVVELDCDEVRGGVKPDTERFDQVIEVLNHSDRLIFQGLYSYAGGTYSLSGETQRLALIERHHALLLQTSHRLRQNGIEVATLGIGSSPALESATTLSGLTEACAGVFVFQDLAQCGIGVTKFDDIAAGVLATVVQHKPDCGRIFVDAGGLALAQDRSTKGQAQDQGYGLVCDANTRMPLANGDIIVSAVSQEHGIIQRRDGSAAPPELLPIASKVWIMPNHACMTVNPYAGYYIAKGDTITDYWPKLTGWETP